MISSFAPIVQSAGPTAQPDKDETYALAGLNMVTPDQVIDTATKRYNKALLGESPYTINSRMLARDSGVQRAAILSRKGSDILLGMHTSSETHISMSNANTVSGEEMFSSTQQFITPITVATYSLGYGFYSLTYLEFHLRKTNGYIEAMQLRIWDDNSGQPGNLLATTSFLSSDVTSTTSLVRAYFMDAPDLASGQKIWATMDIMGTSSAQVFVEVSANTGGLTRQISPVTTPYVSTGTTAIFDTLCYRSGSALGGFRRYVVGETPLTLIATGYGDLVSFEDNGTEAVVYSYSPGYEVFTNKFRFCQIDDRTIFANGSIQPQYLDSSGVTALSAAPTGGDTPFVWNNHLFMRVGNRFAFSDLLSTLSNVNVWPSVNFFYPNTPNDPDVVVGSCLLKDDLYVFTSTTKYRVTMSDTTIATLDIVQVTGTKGGISQDLIGTDGDYIYFIGQDNRLYTFNGVSDELVSDPVEPAIRSTQNSATLSSLHVYDNQVRIYYAASPNTDVNGMLLFDLTYGQWFMDTGRSVAFSITYPLEGTPLVEFSSQTSLIFLGNSTSYSDAGKPIYFKYWTNYKAYGSGAAKKRVKRFRPILKISDRSYTMQIGKDMDFANSPDMRDYLVSGLIATYGGGAKYGDGTKYGGSSIVDNHAGMSGRGRHIQYRFEKNGVNTPIELYGYISLFKIGTNK